MLATFRFAPQCLGILIFVWFSCVLVSAKAEIDLVPYPPDALLKGVLDFGEPTALRGEIFYIEPEKQTIWLDWVQVSEDRPFFEKKWQLVPGEWRIAVFPLNQAQFYQLQQLAKGTVLELVIQVDQEGLRRILSFQSIPGYPKVHLQLSWPKRLKHDQPSP